MKWPGTGVLTATCPGGIEDVLWDELLKEGFAPLATANGAVSFTGGHNEMIRANLVLRTASRVLVPLIEGRVGSYDELYRLARQLNWRSIIPADQTFRVSAFSRDRALSDTRFASLRVKDAVTDSQRAKASRRSIIEKRHPDVALALFLHKGRAELSLDSSVSPLHERGYRLDAGEAPLRENLAAALLYVARWDARTPFLDPFCGSGTIAIEAALMAAGIAPGTLRKKHAFSSWPSVSEQTVREVCTSLRAMPHRPVPTITASDRDPESAAFARANASRAGVKDLLRIEVADAVTRVAPDGPGTIVTNPPYGERLGDSSPGELMRAWADHLKQSYGGWSANFLASEKSVAKQFGLRTNVRAQTWNGGLQVNLYSAEIYPPKVYHQETK
ncbi:MAG: THUMP domain-containing class I SAM-dependent RNA methyltransferase [Spirochaetota bacterium]